MAKESMTTNLKGFKSWLTSHPRKSVSGYFSFSDGTPLNNKQVRCMVDFGIEKGCRTEAEIDEQEFKEHLISKGLLTQTK